MFHGAVRQDVLTLRRRVLSVTTMHRRLDLLPCGLVPAAWPFHDWLTDVGAKRVGQLRKLPGTGFPRLK